MRRFDDHSNVFKCERLPYCNIVIPPGSISDLSWVLILKMFGKLGNCTEMLPLVTYENFQVRNMVRNHCLAKSISDDSSQECPDCHKIVKKSLSH